MKIKVKITATLEIDDEEYHVPADENVGEEIENSFEEFYFSLIYCSFILMYFK